MLRSAESQTEIKICDSKYQKQREVSERIYHGK